MNYPQPIFSPSHLPRRQNYSVTQLDPRHRQGWGCCCYSCWCCCWCCCCCLVGYLASWWLPLVFSIKICLGSNFLMFHLFRAKRMKHLFSLGVIPGVLRYFVEKSSKLFILGSFLATFSRVQHFWAGFVFK